MVKRRKKAHKKSRTTSKRKVAKRSTRGTKATAAKPTAYNRKALWKAYRDLQKKADRAWEKFRADVKKNARSDILIRDHNHLLLLLGECNYMARECMRMSAKNKKRR